MTAHQIGMPVDVPVVAGDLVLHAAHKALS